jgi:NAD(P)-dependent dehydrogenase (short-subunit alcohol dehydrogenase family)
VAYASFKQYIMKVVITGTSQGIGKGIAELFLQKGHSVVGIDMQEASVEHENYAHIQCDVRGELPEIPDVEILVNNAGTQNDADIDTNLKALIRVTEKYGVQPSIKSVLSIGSASGHTGSEFPEYCASKGGVISYTKNVALRIAGFGATCNSLDPGGVLTPLNDCVVNDPVLWDQIMEQTPLRRWALVEEIAAWAYFLTVENRFCTGQSIVVDGGESINSRFIWPE